MKFEVDAREIQSSGSISSKKITLSTNAKAFKIIFGQIYPDIIKAIVRELFANAWDSQKQAENLHTPIDIHLPTTLYPYFTIRDYGTGMTPQLIDDIYSRVFESSKDGSDDEVGMFGMGSKTPLGYTDSFSVMSFVDGIFYAYDIYVDVEGHPSIDLKATGPTDQPNGVEVSLGVDPKDFETFKNYAEIFAFGAGTPININRQRFVNQRDVSMFGDRWVLFADDQHCMIRMGCVVYKIDATYLKSQISNWQDKNKIDDFVKLPLVLDFDIGEFQVTGSREDLIYDAQSAIKIKDRLFSVVDEIRSKVSKDIRRSKNVQAAYNKYQSYLKSKIIDRYSNDRFFYKSWNINNLVVRFSKRSLGVYLSFNNFGRHSNLSRPFKTNEVFLDKLYYPTAKTFVIVEYTDVNVTRAKARIDNFIITLRNNGWRVCDPYWSRDKMYNILHVRCKSTDNLNRLMTVLPENHHIIKLEDLVKPTTTKREKIEDDNIYAFVLSHREGEVMVSSNHVMIDFDDIEHYINIDRHRTVINPNKLDLQHVLNTCKIGPNQVICINKSNEKLISQNKLVNIFDYYLQIKDSVDYDIETYYNAALIQIDKEYRGWYPENIWNNEKRCRIRDFSVVLEYIGAPINTINVSEIDDSFDREINENVKNKYDAIYTSIKDKIDSLYTKHPLFKYIEQHTIRQKMKNILTEIGEM